VHASVCCELDYGTSITPAYRSYAKRLDCLRLRDEA
jgi:hypothetical protein